MTHPSSVLQDVAGDVDLCRVDAHNTRRKLWQRPHPTSFEVQPALVRAGEEEHEVAVPFSYLLIFFTRPIYSGANLYVHVSVYF